MWSHQNKVTQSHAHFPWLLNTDVLWGRHNILESPRYVVICHQCSTHSYLIVPVGQILGRALAWPSPRIWPTYLFFRCFYHWCSCIPFEKIIIALRGIFLSLIFFKASVEGDKSQQLFLFRTRKITPSFTTRTFHTLQFWVLCSMKMSSREKFLFLCQKWLIMATYFITNPMHLKLLEIEIENN